MTLMRTGLKRQMRRCLNKNLKLWLFTINHLININMQSTSHLTNAEETELDRLYLAQTLTPKRLARFNELRDRLMQPIYKRSFETQQRNACELNDSASEWITHDPR